MSDGEIVKVDQRTGQAGRPKKVEIRGSSNLGTPSPTPEVLGAASPYGKTEIVDRHTPQEPQPVEVEQHVELVTSSDEIRGATAPDPTGPQVRVHSMTEEGRKSWESAKRDA